MWLWLAAVTMAGDLQVEVGGITSAAGSVRIGVFASADRFPDDDAITVGQILDAKTAVEGRLVATFPGLAPGRYAVVAVHDKDNDGVLGRNLFGIPNEPYGFANGARGRLGPPSFEAASLVIAEAPVTAKLVVE